MLTHEENELLCRVGPQAPMGKMLRRYWIPALMSEDLEAGGNPKRVRLMGEDLVAFRDDRGRVGLLDELCPHRAASLALGRNENGALECLYHGWRVDCTGRILDMPVEPEESTFKERMRATAYSVYESGGVVWAYMGPKGQEPPPLDLYFTQVPLDRVLTLRVQTHSNWAQGLEGVIDSSHTNLLHQHEVRPSANVTTTIQETGTVAHRPSRDTRPRMESQDTPYGFRYAAIRKPIVDPETQKYVRVSLFIAPIYAMFPPPKGWVWLQAFAPIDDEHTMFYFFRVAEKAITPEQRAQLLKDAWLRPGIDLDDDHRLKGNRSNNWLQDRESMRRRESHTGINGVSPEDIAVQESMGPILDRSKEHLGASDTAVIRFRRMMLDAVKRFGEDGTAPVGLTPGIPYADLRAEEAMVPMDASWHRVSAAGVEAVPA
ncbi:MAG TPA: Rieske 2Fe-2S domain-containing protein [Gemmatimonadaceae bacterium]|nr:Rieske 2Fe-2S domain-containing protein [Gemmatimonadaceae bacterium]